PNEVGKTSVPMMVLAVNVCGNGSAHGHILCSRRHGQKPTAGKEVLNDLGEAHTALAFELAGSTVEGEKTVQPDLPDHAGIFVQGSVAVAAPQAAGNVRGLQARRQRGRHLAAFLRPEN